MYKHLSAVVARPRFLRYSPKEQIVFMRRLAAYLCAGIPILEAVSLLASDAESKSASHILTSLVHTVSEGRPLSSGLRQFSSVMSMYSISMIEVGERSGTLQESLSYLTKALRQQEALRRKLVGALIYPAIIICTTLIISAFLILYAFPKIVPIFRGFGTALPFATRALITLSDFLSRYGLFVLGVMAIIGVLFFIAIRYPKPRHTCDALSLRLPIIGTLLRSYHLASISRILSTLLSSGVGIVVSLELASVTAGNRAYTAALKTAATQVLAGERLADALLSQRRYFPRMYAQMIGTGERSGSLPAALDALRSHYEEEFDSASDSLATLIEPILMIVMGLLVGFIALAIITPVYQITQGMHA